MRATNIARREESLDPEEGHTLCALGHRLLNALPDDRAGVGKRPGWRPAPKAARDALASTTVIFSPTAPSKSAST